MDIDSISYKDFKKVGKYIQDNYGLKMPDQKKYLIQCRLRKRLLALNLSSYREYIEFVFDPENKAEMQKMIDVVTTHKTDFFRENNHFEYMRKVIFPELEKKQIRKINIWSAGCSTGEEPYSIAMTIEEYLEHSNCFDYTIHASDISKDSVNTGEQGVYKIEKTDPIPLQLKKKYFLRNKNPEKKLVRVIHELQKHIKFFTLNLLDYDYRLNQLFDIVMCRNTLIYFDREVQEQVLRKIITYLKRDGILIIGHSESVVGMDLPLVQVKPTIFKKKG